MQLQSRRHGKVLIRTLCLLKEPESSFQQQVPLGRIKGRWKEENLAGTGAPSLSSRLGWDLHAQEAPQKRLRLCPHDSRRVRRAGFKAQRWHDASHRTVRSYRIPKKTLHLIQMSPWRRPQKSTNYTCVVLFFFFRSTKKELWCWFFFFLFLSQTRIWVLF